MGCCAVARLSSLAMVYSKFPVQWFAAGNASCSKGATLERRSAFFSFESLKLWGNFCALKLQGDTARELALALHIPVA